MPGEITIGEISPNRILQKIGGNDMAFAQSYKGEGNISDGNFQNFHTDWRAETPTAMEEIWLEMFLRNAVRAGNRAGFNFCEFWSWPQVRCRDDGTCRVEARLRIVKLKIEHKPRVIQ